MKIYMTLLELLLSQTTHKNDITDLLEQLNMLIPIHLTKEIIVLLKKYINNFSHIEKNKNLDEKM